MRWTRSMLNWRRRKSNQSEKTIRVCEGSQFFKQLSIYCRRGPFFFENSVAKSCFFLQYQRISYDYLHMN
ncbi:hypothetical protein Nepgr_019024 [Nepenthes gracilis]|uniref:Uncharacterized protein n=1 Tax=Nepenthes gracilis TaxID=150966 RepID=A0AAD3ST95_NEPGR|nr:hypothetical protein Nepgr_019024 [Nepenthes gracilis]